MTNTITIPVVKLTTGTLAGDVFYGSFDTTVKNKRVSVKVSNFIKSEEKDYLSELTLSQKLDIEKGIQDLNEGKRIEYSEFLKKIS
jgi:hypothetical protein